MFNDFDQSNQLKIDSFELGIFFEGRSFIQLDSLIILSIKLVVVLNALRNQVLNGFGDGLVIDVKTDHFLDLKSSLDFHEKSGLGGAKIEDGEEVVLVDEVEEMGMSKFPEFETGERSEDIGCVFPLYFHLNKYYKEWIRMRVYVK